LLITVAGILVLGIPLGILGTHLITQDAHNLLERDADEIASALEDHFEESGSVGRAQLTAVAPSDIHVVVTAASTSVTAGAPMPNSALTATSNTGQGLTVRVAQSSESVNDRVRNIWLLIGALALGGTVAGAILGLFEARRISAPLIALAETSDRLGEGDFSARAETTEIPELDAAVRALNRSAEQIAELVANERRLANNVSHQLRTPLTAMRIRLEEALLIDDPDNARQEIEAAVEQVDRLTETIEELMSFTRTGQLGARSRLDLGDVATAHAGRWAPAFRRNARQLRIGNGLAHARVLASAGGVGQALDILLDNSIKHGAGSTTVALAESGGRVIIRVADQGSGVTTGMEDQIFHWDMSTGRGHGIGLALARALVESDGGRLELVRPRPPAFEISYPAAIQETGARDE
jgi:signal transduction histidine kinase